MSDRKMKICNWINGKAAEVAPCDWLEKIDPHSGELLWLVPDTDAVDVRDAVSAAQAAFPKWRDTTAVRRGQLLGQMVAAMRAHAQELQDCIARETGKPPQDAQGEVGAAIAQGEFFAGEGMRMYARSLTSAVPGKHSHCIRQPHGVAALIVPANTPLANIAWKVFPALICGNTVVLKASEDAPRTALLMAEIGKEAGLPDGVFNVVQGSGRRTGSELVLDPRVALISFTGSTNVGRWIAQEAGRRLARVSLELGGKNPFVVCDDAELEHAVHWAVLSAFSNAGQRCAAGSRIIVFEGVYERFRRVLLDRVATLALGVGADCNLGPLINARHQRAVLEAIARAREAGGRVLCGGSKPASAALAQGCYVEPTVIEGIGPEAAIAREELFGPVATLHPVNDLQQALELANASEYGLTAAIHTRSVDRAVWFAHRVRAGVANVNLGTYGSEPHMPFGGFGASGNGTREPGTEALDVYAELKNISFLARDGLI